MREENIQWSGKKQEQGNKKLEVKKRRKSERFSTRS